MRHGGLFVTLIKQPARNMADDFHNYMETLFSDIPNSRELKIHNEYMKFIASDSIEGARKAFNEIFSIIVKDKDLIPDLYRGSGIITCAAFASKIDDDNFNLALVTPNGGSKSFTR